MNPYSGDANIAFTSDGTLLYVPRGIESYSVGKVKWIDMQGHTSPLVDTINAYFSASISPDGQKVALHIQQANDDVWLYHVLRKSFTRLTFGDGNNGFPVWSPDGRFVIYAAERGHAPNIFRKPWDGSGTEERLTTNSHAQLPKAVSPDGKVVAFIQDGDIWFLSLDGSSTTAPFVQSSADETNPAFSPDGRYLAYETNESGRYEVVIVPYPSRNGKWQISSGGGSNAIWSPSGKEIYFTQGSTIYSVTVHPGSVFDFSAPQRVLDLPPEGAFLSGISPDGKRFVMVAYPFKDLGTSEFTLVTDWFDQLKNAFNKR